MERQRFDKIAKQRLDNESSAEMREWEAQDTAERAERQAAREEKWSSESEH